MKTLQDIPLGISKTIDINVRYKIRRAAIAWIKNILKEAKTTIKEIQEHGELLQCPFDWDFLEDHYNSVELAGLLIHFIMDRFNITEEDLK